MKRLLDLPHRDARALLRTGAPVFVCVNPVEYHGPHLSLHNDRLVSEGLAGDLHARLASKHGWEGLIAADLEVGVFPAGGIGSRFVAYPAARRLVIEAVRALVELGAQRLVLMTFHGNPLHGHAVQAGVDWAVKHGIPALAPFHLVLRDQLTLDAERFRAAVAGLAPDDANDVLRRLRFDFHAGFFETSMALNYAPASVSPTYRELPACPDYAPDRPLAIAARAARALGWTRLGAELEFAAVGTGWGAMRPYYGYTSRPSLASAEAGAAFARHIVDLYEPVASAVLTEGAPPPRPIFPRLPGLTLGGRLMLDARPRPEDVVTPE